MATNHTENLGLNTWLESDPVDFEEINENFEKIDSLVSCIESGTATADFTGGTSTIATWRYKKYSDGTIDMSAKLYFTSLRCNGGSGSPYYSGTSTVYFPFTLTEIYDVQMHLASNTIGWVSNTTDQTVLDKVMFRVMSTSYESTDIYKQIFINVKGAYS